MGKQRILYWDVAKAVAKICVVWGHCLQNLTTDSDYWLNDPISQIIISFHMPLFMLVSGYFAYSSLRKSFFDVMKRKTVQLLVPSIVWGTFVCSLAVFLHRDFTIERLLYIAQNTLYSYWFLKSLFMCFLIVMLGLLIGRWSRLAIFLYVCIVIAAGVQLNYASTISMLPFFCSGLLLRKYEVWIFEHSRQITLGTVSIYIISMICWHSKDYNIYLNPFQFTMGG